MTSMPQSKSFQVTALDTNDAENVIQAIEVLHRCFSDKERYSIERLGNELVPESISKSVGFYRQFFVATINECDTERVVGVAGVKAADWASDTHVLYMSAVHPEYRNRGIGKKLVKTRIDWIHSQFVAGRVLVSTAKIDRFKQFGFKAVTQSSETSRSIMLMEF